MKRSAITRKTPELDILAVRRQREQERNRRMLAMLDAMPTAPRRPAVMALAKAEPVKLVPPRITDRRDQRIRDSARGEDCTVRIPGICTGNPEHTIWSHAPLGAAGKGRGLKAIDLAGAYCCTACDAAIDGQRPLPAGYDRAQALLDWMFGHLRSLVRLKQKGLA